MYADVILPLPLTDLYTYSVPADLKYKIEVGCRVMVPFGRKRYYTAIVKSIHNNPPENFEAKDIYTLIDSRPVVDENQLKLWEWISFYYITPLGEVYKTALPSSLKSDNLKQKFVPKTEVFLQTNPNLDHSKINTLIGRAKKQLSFFEEFKDALNKSGKDYISKKKASELSDFTTSVLNGLLKKQVLQSLKVEVGRLEKKEITTRNPYPLNKHQQKALKGVKEVFKTKQCSLLHGVTSSGKTEIFIHLITSYLKEKQQTLYLVPEIALTTQLTNRLQDVFGNKMGVYHSGINEQERAEIWRKMTSDDPYEIILGVRSSLFLPFQNLGLVIVDEEHEMSYKQQDPAPRYHARDTAVMLSHIHNAKTLLGTATPSLESYHNTQNGKYGLVTLKERFNEILMPEIIVENVYELRKRKKMKTLLAPSLIEQIDTALQNGEQVILFRNRRGFAPLIECKDCGWTPKCIHCDVTLTFHKKRNRLICHYCNTSYQYPSKCQSCHSESLVPLGQGTEQLEEEVSQLFPNSKVSRMDFDTTRGKNSYEKILSDFRNAKTNILIGTQMLSKGLDFENVNVVGIISADSLLNYPDFRSNERGFQLMMQAAGRAGRQRIQGKVIIQSSDPDRPVYQHVKNHDYSTFYKEELNERREFKYPPIYKLIRIVIKHKNNLTAEKAATQLVIFLKSNFKNRVLGPNKGVISRVQTYYIQEILLKLEIGLSIHQVRDHLKNAENKLRKVHDFKYITVYYDVDPL